MSNNANAESNVFVPPVIEHGDWDDSPERLHLFTITRPNPENPFEEIPTEYTMPNKPHPGLGLAFLRIARLQGIELAMSWLLEEAVGTEGYLALAAEPDVSQADISAIIAKVRKVVLGGLEGPKGS